MGFGIGARVKFCYPPDIFGMVIKFYGGIYTVDWGSHEQQHPEQELIPVVAQPATAIGWQDNIDSSRRANVLPGIHAACFYANDGSCWEWLVTTKQTGANIVGGGKAIDRRTAKSDAEFFITNYKPEDTTERDEIRSKLERSWRGA